MKVIEKSWAKRRIPEKEKKVINVRIPDYKQEQNHFCDMHVEYEDGTKATYIARVIHNEIKDEWIVDGMHVAVKI
ncbi:MAG: hypothetical protein DRQ58_06800 [Gammaproteobacteria bacterium]|nr:MAG: hypothetical protein DRQ58_06800 [Gammaproteobacteria bacterium]